MYAFIFIAILGQVFVPSWTGSSYYSNPATQYEIQEAMVRNQMMALNNQRLSLSIQGGDLWRHRYRSYKNWRMERLSMDKSRQLELAKFYRDFRKEKSRLHTPRLDSRNKGFVFAGKTFPGYEELRKDPGYQRLIASQKEDREREIKQEKRDIELAIRARAERKHPDEYYRKLYASD